ncbi:hypothetical protein BDN72DRAFT_792505 [Pluteus cervinus]|uniref:Uncharacterized protein n=1 Tax=Pluteus cervinus TaxID=181527 RepID=A0ACD3B3P0_9AGAR|nr:hypothetical protein BDN72DRAFT_792505 [Pluteus cervinus]
MAPRIPSSSTSRAKALLLLLAFSLPSASAYSWKFQSPPKQCSNLTISIDGAGTPPYRVLILPFGPSPLPNNTEVRKIVDQTFPAGATSVSFQLKYPADSQLVAVVSDATGFGSGGTSVAAQVVQSTDTSCFDATQMVSPLFVFSIEPPNQIVQCVPTRIWWDPSNVQGTPNFLGVIPGGQSFSIPEGQITNVPSEGTGFSYTPSLRGGTTFILVGGDARGNGTAGSSLNTVSSGIDNVGSCLNDNSPSSTPGNPAGGAYPTSSSGGVGGNDGTETINEKNDNLGAIIGGVVGGVALLVALVLTWLFMRRRNDYRRTAKERPIDIDDEVDDSPSSQQRFRPNELPHIYQPEPFMVADSTLGGSVDGHGHLSVGGALGGARMSTEAGSSSGRPLSGYTTTASLSRSGTPDLLGSTYGYGVGGASAPGGGSSTGAGGRKGAMKPLRPVNIIQHDDAGPTPRPEPSGEQDEPETIELPPAYSKIRPT